MQRIFLGWEKSIVDTAAEWLWQRRAELTTMCLVVPTSQAARKLRDVLAEKARATNEALLGLRFVTPAHFRQTSEPTVAAAEIDILAWMEVLEQEQDWSILSAAFPQAPGEGEEPGWSLALAQSLYGLRLQLQDAGLLIRDASHLLSKHMDGARWSALARLEERVEKKLYAWDYQSRSHWLRQQFTATQAPCLPHDAQQLVVIGVTDAPHLVTTLWQRHQNAFTLIAAPASEADRFDSAGRPLTSWNEQVQAFPGRAGILGSVSLVNDFRQLGERAIALVAADAAASDQVMLATCDPLLGDPLVKCFAKAGWVLFNPAATGQATDGRVWLRHWLRWLISPQLSILSDIAGFPETRALTNLNPQSWASALATLRDQWLVQKSDDVARLAAAEMPYPPHGLADLLEVLKALDSWRKKFLQSGFPLAMTELASCWKQARVIDEETYEGTIERVQCWNKILPQVKRDATFWLTLFLETSPPLAAERPDDRALDVEGWLEISFNHSPLLLICGMSDQVIPARGGGEPWLAEGSRLILGITSDEQRAARDAYLYHAVIESRRNHGSIHIICSKTDLTGKNLHPSRILLRAGGTELAERVQLMFQEIEPSDAQMTWQKDWSWQPRLASGVKEKEGVSSLSITSLRDYLMCPYRFYLKNALKMNACEMDRGEWNHRDFGTTMHEILESWGKDTSAKNSTNHNDIATYLSDSLSDYIRRWYGENHSLALNIQAAALRQRFAWFAAVQALRRSEGWRIHDVETPFSLPLEFITLRGKVDRIDQHEGSGEWVMWDYKSGKLKGDVTKEHYKQKSSRTRVPEHLDNDPRLFFLDGGGKEMMWTNLQLPLYSAAGLTPTFAGVGYIAMGEAQEQVIFDQWPDFSTEVMNSATSCAQMLLENIHNGKFWPPAEKSQYENFACLAAGADLSSMTEPTHLATP